MPEKLKVSPPELTAAEYAAYAQQPKELLIVDSTHIGDHIMQFNYFAEIKRSEKYRGYRLVLLGNIVYRELAEYLNKGVIDQFLWMPDRPHCLSASALELVRSKLHTEQGLKPYYDTVIFLSGNSVNLKLKAHDHLLSGVASRARVVFSSVYSGVKAARLLHFTHVFIGYDHRKKFEFERYKDFFESILESKIELSYPVIAAEQISATSVHSKQYVVVAPGASIHSKMWHRNNWVELIKTIIQEFKLEVVIVCSSSETGYVSSIKSMLDIDKVEIKVQAGLPPESLLSLLSSAKLFIGVDSGIYHIAVALGRPALALSSGHGFYRFTRYPAERKNAYYLLPNGVENWLKETDIDADSDDMGQRDFFSINAIRSSDVTGKMLEIFNIETNN